MDKKFLNFYISFKVQYKVRHKMFYNIQYLTFCVPESGPVTISDKTVYYDGRLLFFCIKCGSFGHTCITPKSPCKNKPQNPSIVEGRFSRHPVILDLLRESSRKQTKKSANKTHHAKDCSASIFDCLRDDDDEKPFVPEQDDEPEKSKVQLMKDRKSYDVMKKSKSYDFNFPAFLSTPVKSQLSSLESTTFRDSLATPVKVNPDGPTCPGAPKNTKWKIREYKVDLSTRHKLRNESFGPIPSFNKKNILFKKESWIDSDSDSESYDEEVTGASLAEDLNGDAW